MIAPLLALVACSWLALLLAAPIMQAPFSTAIYVFGSFICHQLPERSFHLAGFQLPVCARCLGIYAGGAAGALVAAVRLKSVPARTVLVAGAVPTLITVALEALDVWHTSNIARALAGAPLGFAVAIVVVRALATLHYDECAPPRPTATSR